MQTETPTVESVQITVNEQLVQFNNLIDALSYLVEECRTRDFKTEITNAAQEYLSSEAYQRRIINWLKRYQLRVLARHVSEDVKTLINDQMENYILSKIDERVNNILASRGR